MVATEARQATIANNIANASTPGFKRHTPVLLGFQNVFHQTMKRPFHYNIEAAPGGGVKTVETFADIAAGPLRITDNPLDTALHGPGYFVVDTPQGERFTRAGEFTVGTGGLLTTRNGHAVQSVTSQPIDVSAGNVLIGDSGIVTAGGVNAGQIRLVEFEEPTRLMREGNSLFTASQDVLQRSAAAVDTTLGQGELEMSNVNSAAEMIDMMLGLRAYEANQRVIQTVDTTIGRLIDQVGMPR
jgi:flagellar basal-body rod protein FlgG